MQISYILELSQKKTKIVQKKTKSKNLKFKVSLKFSIFSNIQEEEK
jgi:hypothetical protein